jgi:hypothetical protein
MNNKNIPDSRIIDILEKLPELNVVIIKNLEYIARYPDDPSLKIGLSSLLDQLEDFIKIMRRL